MSSRLLVAAATAGARVQQSSDGARWPLMSLRFNSAINDRSKPSCSLSAARSRIYGQDTGMLSSATFRSQPPKIGIQYPNRIRPPSRRRRESLLAGLSQQPAEVAGYRGERRARSGRLDLGVVVRGGVDVVRNKPPV